MGFVERDMCSLGSWERGSLNGPDCAIGGGGGSRIYGESPFCRVG